MQDAGLVAGCAGNASARVADHPSMIAITPTSIPYDSMTADQISLVDLSSGQQIGNGPSPSSELPTHLAIYRARGDVRAIVHTHSPWVSVLSVLHRPLPPVIDEMAVFFGREIPVAPYAFTGTEILGDNVVRALGEWNAVILSNHGNFCTGSTLSDALQVAIKMEASAEVFVNALRLGEPVSLPDDAINLGAEMFRARQRAKKES